MLSRTKTPPAAKQGGNHGRMDTARCAARGNPAGFAATVIGAEIAQEIGLQHQLQPTP